MAYPKLNYTARSDTSVTVTYTTDTINQGMTYCQVWMCNSSGTVIGTTMQRIAPSGNQWGYPTSAYYGGLSAGTTYHFIAYGYATWGEMGYGDILSVTTTTTTQKCTAPSSVWWSTEGNSSRIYAEAQYDVSCNINYQFCLVSSSNNWYAQNYYTVTSLSAHQQIQFRAYCTKSGYLDSDYTYGSIFEMPPTPSVSPSMYSDGAYISATTTQNLSGFTTAYDFRIYYNTNGTYSDWKGGSYYGGDSNSISTSYLSNGDIVYCRYRYCDNSYVHAWAETQTSWGWSQETSYSYSPYPSPPTVSVSSLYPTDISVLLNITWSNNASKTKVIIRRVSDDYEVISWDLTSTSEITCYTNALVPNVNYYAYGISKNSDDSYNDSCISQYVYFKTLDYPVAPTLSIASGYPTETAVVINFTWGARAVRTSITIMHNDTEGDPVQDVYWETTNTSITQISWVSLTPATHYYIYGNSYSSMAVINEEQAFLEFDTLGGITPPILSFVSSDTTSVTINISWCQYANTVELRLVRIYDGYIFPAMTLSKGTTTKVITGLSPFIRYYAIGWSVSSDGNTNSSNSDIVLFYTKPLINFSFNFTSGQAMIYNPDTKTAIITTASNWNNFTTNINQFRVWKDGSDASFTTASAGMTFTASIYNEAITAMMGSPLNLTTSSDLVISGVTPITAQCLNKLQTLLQSL